MRLWLIVGALVVLAISTIIAVQYCDDWTDVIGVVGSVASVLGLTLVFAELVELKRATRVAVEAAVTELRGQTHRRHLEHARRLLSDLNILLQSGQSESA